ncbi:MAG: sugar phosphate isomerase/epimerase [Clostridia bacterium]|nr:sugar phosphate isomerase/epimerase [Clostridia bacterium]
MKIGLSSYSMDNLMQSGEMTILDVMCFAKENGAEHIELVPFGFTLVDDKTGVFNEELITAIKAKSAELSLPISNYAVLGDLLKPDRDAYLDEVERLKLHIDVAAKLGIKQMRHDVSSFRRPLETNTQLDFEREFPQMVEACRTLADYAADYGITTLVENHGFFVNGSDRVIRLVEEVDRKNFRMVVDTGNFACMDECCEIAVKKCMPYADMIHLKDFYIRKTSSLPSIGGLFRCDSGNWFSTVSGYSMLRGSILAQGDLEIGEMIATIKEYGFEGYVSIEFEGMEDPRAGSIAGLQAARYYTER